MENMVEFYISRSMRFHGAPLLEAFRLTLEQRWGETQCIMQKQLFDLVSGLESFENFTSHNIREGICCFVHITSGKTANAIKSMQSWIFYRQLSAIS